MVVLLKSQVTVGSTSIISRVVVQSETIGLFADCKSYM